MGFAAEVRELTRADHRAAQSVTYFDALLSGQLDRAGYAALLGQLHVIYQTLEEAADAMRDDPVAGPFVIEELRRLPSIVDDLSFLHGPDWSERFSPSAATVQYQARLREVAFSWPAGFVAHHYTRYLGDLSGGQVMARALRSTFGFDTDGIRFFLFPGLDARTFKQHYRELLDLAAWDAVERQRFLDEVSYAYRLNTAMLDELGQVVTQASAA
ncbi:heme oxygenase (biliverdin-producing) [Micromonospora sp. DT229]|uniref:biliverdin-producing heme oxygenase n=1 Tax=Micromonospora sp. DT229 TaxID=3393430 RepID=UPI003CF2201C